MTTERTGPLPPLPPPPDPRWDLSPPADPREVSRLSSELNLPQPLCSVLAVRGLGSPDEARGFLRPLIDHLHPPEALRDGAVAARRITEAMGSGETIFVHGDYDVDGICATALLTGVLRGLGGQVVPFVPHRLRDGYDLGEGGIQAAKGAGAGLLVTVDCGIRALDAVRSAREAGMDVIITDHHTPGDTLPDALAVVNPSRADATYPAADLCGAGVAFKLAQLVAARAGHPDPRLLDELDLVALATVADLVPLQGENRTLVRFGLKVLAEAKRPGLKALLEVTGLAGGEITAGRIGFALGPRLNAAGRVGETQNSLDLLLSDDIGEARRLAQELERDNARRQDEDRAALDQALEILRGDFDPESDFGVVLAGEGWHPGVIGIVASRVVERIHRPAILISIDGETARGSARSIPGFDLLGAVTACSSHLRRFGGHRQAAGMELATTDLPAFRSAFRSEARRRLAVLGELRPVLRGDLVLGLEEVSAELVRYLGYMGPFGMGNRRPVFFAGGVRVEGAREVGTGHLKARLRQGSATLEGIGFGLAHRLPPGSLEGRTLDAAFHLEENRYRGRTSIQARILDLRDSGDDRTPPLGVSLEGP